MKNVLRIITSTLVVALGFLTAPHCAYADGSDPFLERSVGSVPFDDVIPEINRIGQTLEEIAKAGNGKYPVGQRGASLIQRIYDLVTNINSTPAAKEAARQALKKWGLSGGVQASQIATYLATAIQRIACYNYPSQACCDSEALLGAEFPYCRPIEAMYVPDFGDIESGLNNQLMAAMYRTYGTSACNIYGEVSMEYCFQQLIYQQPGLLQQLVEQLQLERQQATQEAMAQASLQLGDQEEQSMAQADEALNAELQGAVEEITRATQNL